VLAGCAPNQPQVAATLVRLRKLYRSADVTLTESSASKGAAGSSTSVSRDSGGQLGCAKYTFTTTVSFDGAPATPEAKKVPASLGGGS